MSTAPAVRFLDRTTPPHIVTLVLMAGIAAMNMSVFLPSLPAMAAHFGTDYAVMQLSVSLYLATTAALQIVIGPLSDRFGRRPVMLGALGIFLFATLGCLLAPSVLVFLVFRMIQGAVVVGIVLSRAVVRDMVPQNEAASMIGYVTMGMALVPMIAPMVGGGLDELFGWRAVFVFLLLSGVFVTWLTWADQGETATTTGTGLREQAKDYPELLASPRFWGYAMGAAFSSGAFFAFLGGAPYAASAVYGMSAFWTGVAFGAPAIGYATGNFLSGRYSARVGIDAMMLWGAAIVTSGLAVLVMVTLLGASHPVLFFGFVTSVGVGNGMVIPNANAMMLWGAAIVTSGLAVLVMVTLLGASHPVLFFGFVTSVGVGNGMVIPNATSGMLSVRPHLAGTASGLGGAIMIGGGAALSVLAGVLIEGASTSLPLSALMLATSACSLACVVYVIRRTRRLAAA